MGETNIGALTSGLLKITVADGVATPATAEADTDYLAPDGDGSGLSGVVLAETDPIVGAITGIVKADGAGNISAAAAGTDYVAPISTPASLADGASCLGQEFNAVANETLSAGDQVVIASNGKMAKGKADAAATMPIVATVLVGGDEDDAITCSTHGVFVRNDTWPALTVGAQVFASAATAGALTNTAPSTSGHKAQVLGVAFASKTVLFGNFEYGDVL